MNVEIPGISLHVFVQKWNSEWKNGHIQQLRSVGAEKFVLKIHTKNGTHEILIALPSLITQTTHKWKAEENQPSFVNATKKELDNAKIEKVEQEGVDRVLTIHTTQGNLIIELFGDGNLILTDKQNKILAVHAAREWKGRTLKRNHIYKPPAGPVAWDALPDKISELQPSAPFRSVGSWMVSTLGIPPVSTEAWAQIAGRKPEDTQPLTQAEWKKLHAFMKKKYDSSFMSWMKTEHKGKEWVLHCLEKGESENNEWKKAFGWIEESILNEKKEDVKNEDPHAKERAALNVNLERQQNQVDAWENDSKEKQKMGEWIYGNFDLVTQLIDSVKRGKKQKVNDTKMLSEIRKKIPAVERIDSEKGEIELTLEEE